MAVRMWVMRLNPRLCSLRSEPLPICVPIRYLPIAADIVLILDLLLELLDQVVSLPFSTLVSFVGGLLLPRRQFVRKTLPTCVFSL